MATNGTCFNRLLSMENGVCTYSSENRLYTILKHSQSFDKIIFYLNFWKFSKIFLKKFIKSSQ